jgi:hypothetical protein
LDYAIVIDAKYTSRINSRHQDGVRKYNEIRSTTDDRPVVKQVWWAYPSDSNIAPWDDAVEWAELGPNRPQNENINGTLGIIPPSSPAAEGSDSAVNETMLDFAKGILAYLGIVGTQEGRHSVSPRISPVTPLLGAPDSSPIVSPISEETGQWSV